MNTATAKPGDTSCGCSGATAGCRCGCCAGVQALVPQSGYNRPGLAALRYRIGTQGSFLQSLLARLSSHVLWQVNGDATATAISTRPLADLRTRDPGDASIAVLDAWATMADVLTFYQERIANEGYLRTATELRSLVEMARLVGYRPRPGVAASVYLSYTIDANTVQEIVVPKGARATSVPAQGELPQPFETAEDLRARAGWNRLGLRLTEPQQWDPATAAPVLWLAGTQTRLKPGDPLLIDPGTSAKGTSMPVPYRVLVVEPDAKAERTAVTVEPWDPLLAKRLRVSAMKSAAAAASQASASVDVGTLNARIGALSLPPSHPLPAALQLPRSLASSFDVVGDAGIKLLGAAAPALKDTLAPAIAGYLDAAPAQPLRIWALRQAAGLFGRAFPKRSRTVFEALRGQDDASDRTATTTEEVGEWPIVSGLVLDADGKLQLAARESPNVLMLDSAREGIVPDSLLFVDASAVPTFADSGEDPKTLIAPVQPLLVSRVRRVFPKVARADYGTSGETVAIELGSDAGAATSWFRNTVKDADDFKKRGQDQAVWNNDFQLLRKTVVYLQSELLPLAEMPLTQPLCAGDAAAGAEPIELDGLYAGLEPGRFVLVTGERTDIGATVGVRATEPAMITAVAHDVRAAGKLAGPLSHVAERLRSTKREGDTTGRPAPPALPGDRTHTFIWLDKRLSYCYRRDTVAILGNVVKATHGETRIETLGAGDASKAMQRFELKQSPLTHLAAATAAGSASTLEVRVNDVRWYESDGFFDQSPTARIFLTRTDDVGKTTVQFGDGQEGARPATGADNVRAAYRSGIGRAGNVQAGQITQLASRPLGVKEVNNPLRASGGADREGVDALRANTPLAVQSLDRLVATSDYADFARSFAGIGKADAQELSDGRRNLVHVTVAGIDDGPIDEGSDLLLNLRRAVRDLGDPFQPVQLAVRELRLLIVSAGLRIADDARWEPVATAVRAALVQTFGFRRRDLARGVASSEVLAAIQQVRGVSWVDLDVFGAIDTLVDEGTARRIRTPSEVAVAVQAVAAAGVAPAASAVRAQRSADGRSVRPAQLLLLSADVPETLVLNQIP